MKKNKKIVLSVLMSILVVFGLCCFNIRNSNAVQHNVNFGFSLTDDAIEKGIQIATYRHNDESGQDETLSVGQMGEYVGVLSEDHENNNELFVSRLEPIYSTGEPVPSEKFSAICQNENYCVITVALDLNGDENDIGVRFSRGGNASFEILDENGEFHSGTADNLTQDTNFMIGARDFGYEFSGEAFLFWACGENDEETCWYYFDDLESTMDNLDQSSFDYQYYRASDIVDERTGEAFDIFGIGDDVDRKRGFVLPDALLNYINQTIHENMTLDEFFGRAEFDNFPPDQILEGTRFYIEEEAVRNSVCNRDVDWEEFDQCINDYASRIGMPVLDGVKINDLTWSDKGTYRSHGDNQFKVFIYSDDYRAVEVKDFEQLDYIPFQFGTAPVGVFGTSTDNPAIMEMPLQDDSIKIRALAVDGEPLNGFSISEIRALGVPEGAVTISERNREFEITWHSNFFDQVMFLIKDEGGKEYYLTVERTTFGEIRMEHANQWNNNFNGVRVEFFFDDQTSYSDYELTATIVYRDGKEEIVMMENLGWVDNNRGGNLKFGKEYDGNNDNEGDMSGKNLKRANYGVAFSERDFQDGIDEIYFNVKYTGSSSENYQGTFAGSGRGYSYNVYHDDERLGEE